MSVTLPRLMWGWEVTSANSKLDFVDNATTFAATLRYGTYLPAEFAAEVQRAMRAANTDNQNNACSFSFSTRKFTLTGTSTFQLLWSTGTNAASDCNGLLGFAATDETGATSYTSDDAVGAGSSTAYTWAPTDPVHATTPVTAAADGTTATLMQRLPFTQQMRTDGGLRESVYFSTDKILRLTFRWITGGERTNMESFLDWAVRGRRFNYQPDADATEALRLVMRDPSEIAGVHEELTLGNISYPELTFVEALSRT